VVAAGVEGVEGVAAERGRGGEVVVVVVVVEGRNLVRLTMLEGRSVGAVDDGWWRR
jgi:hypothetical protein